MPFKRSLEDKFWRGIGGRMEQNDFCWPWHGSFSRHGYGVLWASKKKTEKPVRISAHRLAWILFRSEIPDGLFVLHRCDTPPCCNPDHLFLGTQSENLRDAAAKGRVRPPSALGRKHSDETKAKMREARVRAFLERPELRQRYLNPIAEDGRGATAPLAAAQNPSKILRIREGPPFRSSELRSPSMSRPR